MEKAKDNNSYIYVIRASKKSKTIKLAYSYTWFKFQFVLDNLFDYSPEDRSGYSN